MGQIVGFIMIAMVFIAIFGYMWWVSGTWKAPAIVLTGTTFFTAFIFVAVKLASTGSL